MLAIIKSLKTSFYGFLYGREPTFIRTIYLVTRIILIIG